MHENIFSILLTEAQEHLLAHRPNFAIAPWCPLNADYITTVKQASQNLTLGEADELWVEVKIVLKKAQPPDPTSTGMKGKHLKVLREANNR